MKKVLLLSLALLFVASATSAQLGYIGLFADELHETWCVTGTGFYPVEMWIWCLPGDLGQICAEFMVAYPANTITSTVTTNPDVSVTLGTLDTGMSACKAGCVPSGWNWYFHQLVYVTDPTPTYIEIVPNPDVGVYQFANCEPGYPTEPCTKLTNLYLNYGPDAPECTVYATESKSWGAIKSLYR